MKIVEIRNACKSYDSHAVLRDCNLNVKQGSIYALMGSSGCGKTTLLSSIVGILKIDSGTIKVAANQSRIGFMPQNTSLVEEFSINELIQFFGTLYGMQKKEIADRLKFLMNLLDLGDSECLIKNCSGGQKRRVSLAVCLIHQPEILILDEPSVGLDPILRNTIWDFFISIASTGNTTVILSTHYIEEAKQANCIGLLRNGVLVAEDSPENLLIQFGTDSLEKAFLKLCEAQESLGLKLGRQAVCGDNDLEQPSMQENSSNESTLSEKLPLELLKIKALITKNFLQIRRQPTSLMWALFTPFLCLLSFYLTIGGNPIGLKIGIVNGEIKDFAECSGPFINLTKVIDDTCRVDKISCRFINCLNDSIAEKIFFRNFDDAENAVRSGLTQGIIYFSPNFTASMRPLRELLDLFEDRSSNGDIQIFLDQSDMLLTNFLKQRLYETFVTFIENLMEDCGKSKKIGASPILVNTLFGSFEDTARRSMTPGIIISMYFFLTSMLSSTAFVSDRLDGVWNRVLLAGVQPTQILVSHIIFNAVIMILQSFEFLIITTQLYELENRGDNWTAAALLLLVGFSAIVYGLAVSTLATDFTTATLASSCIFLPVLLACGIFWPIAAVPFYIRCLAYGMPFTLPTEALRSILYKGSNLTNSSVQLGFLVVILWILIPLLVCLLGLRRKRFLPN